MATTTDNRPDQISYLLNKIPRDLWEVAKEKAKANDPPLRMQYLIIELLRRYVRDDPAARKRLKVNRHNAAYAERRRRLKASAGVGDAPDLGGSF